MQLILYHEVRHFSDHFYGKNIQKAACGLADHVASTVDWTRSVSYVEHQGGNRRFASSLEKSSSGCIFALTFLGLMSWSISGALPNTSKAYATGVNQLNICVDPVIVSRLGESPCIS